MTYFNRNPIDRLSSEQDMREQAQQEAEKTPYVERPRGQRIFAWVLAGLVTVGVVLYFCWIAGILHV